MIKQEKITETIIDEEGIVSEKTTSKEIFITSDQEPNYIKIYTKMWCMFKSVPEAYTKLFIELAMRMSYCNANDLKGSQIVYTGQPIADELLRACDWTNISSLRKGLKVLCDCNVIKKINRGCYQINPEYAGRGSWKYNPKENQGGIKDLIATFNFKNNSCNTTITWADDGTENELNECYRKGLNVSKNNKTQIKTYQGEIDLH